MRKVIYFLGTITTLLLARTPADAQSGFKLFFEKVYLHTDRWSYLAGDDLWYKAYLVNAQTNFLLNTSNNLHVELIRSDGKIISRKLTRLDNGVGNGDFKLPDTLASGMYKIRAYTNWMLNFGDKFIFEKKIQISRITGEQAAKIVRPATASSWDPDPSASNPAGELIQFFPEGGSLICGVESVVAFKLNRADSSAKIAGSIYEETGKKLCDFSSNEAGFGSFMLTPQSNKGYYASGGGPAGQNFRVELPAALLNGFGITVTPFSRQIKLVLSTNTATLDGLQSPAFTLVVRSRGRKYILDKFQVKNLKTELTLDREKLPEGVNVVTVYDDKSRPVCERLVYNHLGSDKLIIKTNRTKYGSHSPLSVEISLRDTAGKPVDGNVSLAVTDAKLANWEGNITSYLNLQSEIRGAIINPRQYFDSLSTPIQSKLDLLLLTQGWRDYLWKRLADSALRISYAPEQGIPISGRVRKIWSKSTIQNANITLFAPKASGQKLFAAKTDTAGRFFIPDVVFFGYQYLNFSSRKNDGRKAGWIQVDSVTAVIPPVQAFSAAADVGREISILRKIAAENTVFKKQFSFTDTNRLAEVVVRQGKNTLPVEKFHITGEDHKNYSNLMQYLLHKIPGSLVGEGTCGPDSAYKGLVLMYRKLRVSIRGSYSNGARIEQALVCPWDYLGQPMNQILEITIRRRTTIDGIIPSVSVLLRPNALETGNFAFTMADLEGYYSARTFYNPLNRPSASDANFSAATIYWQANVHIKEGHATVKFPHLGSTKNAVIEVEGITNTGRPIAATTCYMVE